MMILNEEVLANQDGGFDFVYIDGSHEADDTFLDAELAWRLTRLGGLIILDDYRWDKEPVSSMHHPARGLMLLSHCMKGSSSCCTKDPTQNC